MTLFLAPLHELSELTQLVHWIDSDVTGQQWLPVYTNPHAVLSMWRTPGHEFFLASQGDAHIGFAHVEYLTAGEASFSYYVQPEYRGQGLGGVLIETLRIHLRQTQGINRLLALVDSHNEASKRSLVRAGFTLESQGSSAFVHVYASLGAG